MEYVFMKRRVESVLCSVRLIIGRCIYFIENIINYIMFRNEILVFYKFYFIILF